MGDSKIARLRLVGLFEGLSFLILLFIAMPLKYMAGEPMAVKIAGMAHGILFVLFIAALYDNWNTHRWSLKFAGLSIFCSIIPFGPFWLDKKLKEKELIVLENNVSTSS